MKKLLSLFYCTVFMPLCFALPNITLYKNAEFRYKINNNIIYDKDNTAVMNIRDDKLYDVENDEYLGTIAEDDNLILFTFYFDEEIDRYSEYDISTGILLLEKIYSAGKLSDCISYDERTGLEIKTICYFDNEILYSVISEYEKEKLVKELYYKSDDTYDGHTEYIYDKKTGIKIKKNSYNASERITESTEYDRKTTFRTKKNVYDDNGFLKSQTTYDKDTGNAIERFEYTENVRKPIKRTFLRFDSDGNYNLNDGYYLNCKMCYPWELKNYEESSKDAPIEWNENYSAHVRKYDFTPENANYKCLEYLKNNLYLSEKSFVLGKRNSNFYYSFDIDFITNEIDLSSCYEIELIKKERDYSAMNKSGAGKGPFGFDIGMTYEEVKEACGGNELEHIADDRYYAKPKKAHPLFETYIVWISDSYGLYYIKGLSRNIATSDYGTEPKREFTNLLSTLEKKYGKFKLTDTVKSDYYWKSDKDWMRALRDGARTYHAIWTISDKNPFDYNGLLGIILGIECSNKYTTSGAYIWLEYEFLNSIEAEQAKDDVL